MTDTAGITLFRKISGGDGRASWKDFEKFLRPFDHNQYKVDDKSVGWREYLKHNPQTWLQDEDFKNASKALGLDLYETEFGRTETSGAGLTDLGLAIVRVGGGKKKGLTLQQFLNLRKDHSYKA